MWLVSQPNSVILEVKVDQNAIGQDCLEKVRLYINPLLDINIISGGFTIPITCSYILTPKLEILMNAYIFKTLLNLATHK